MLPILIGLYMCMQKGKKKKLNIVPSLNKPIRTKELGENMYLCINEQMNCNFSQYNKLIYDYDYI